MISLASGARPAQHSFEPASSVAVLAAAKRGLAAIFVSVGKASPPHLHGPREENPVPGETRPAGTIGSRSESNLHRH